MNELLRFEAAQERLNTLYAEAARERQIARPHPTSWRRTWILGHWRLALRLSHTA